MSNAPSSLKSILITNLYLASRTGSELHVLELAKAFASSGWAVTCYTLVEALPLMEEFAESHIKVVKLGHEEELDDHYTVLYAQHHLVSDYLWTNTDIAFDKIVVSSLGPQSEHEKLPLLSRDADLFVYVSEETRLANPPSRPETSSLVFPNCVSDDFLNAPSMPNNAHGSMPSNITVISNHVVPELRELANELGQTRSISYFGTDDCSVEVTPSFLQSFDLVITIGRSVVACFATHTPVYLYDLFGGEGYLSPSTVDHAAEFNFSGRPDGRRRTARELLDDIDSRYETACSHLEELHGYARKYRSFTRSFSSLLATIDSLAPSKHSPRAFEPVVQIKQRYLVEDFAYRYCQTLGSAQLFYPDSQGFLSEECSERLRYHYGSRIVLTLDRSSRPYTRLDPDDNPVCCETGQGLTALNSSKTDARGDIFLTDDPQYSIAPEAKRIEFTCRRINARHETVEVESQNPPTPTERKPLQRIRELLSLR